jgi:hypothetical protein
MASPCKPAVREADIQQEIRLALGLEPGLVLWRNNVGAAVHAGTNRPVQYGVGGKGGSDLIGLLNGRFVALEIKTPTGRVSAEQLGFIDCVRTNGGFAAIVHSVDEAREAIARDRRGEGG